MGMMKVLAVLFVVAVYSSEAAIKCYQGKQGAEKLADCAGDKAEATKCSGPKFTEYTGLAADVEYACGSCTAETEGKTCVSTDAEKNKVETGEAFKCKNWEYKTDKDTKVANAGCGPCLPDDKTKNLCAECDKAECNSGAASFFAVFVPLIAALYTLL